MRLQQEIDFTTLNWVKQELDETLKQARQALEAYVEDPADSSLMRFCATYLHQVQGTLRMVELYGAAMVVEEMERVAQGLLDDAIRNKNDAYEVLMRGIVQLPDYLERLQGGHKDIPIVLLPLLNDLRACRGEKLLSEGVLFSPDLASPLPPSAAGPAKPLPELEMKSVAARLRTNYQMALVKWLRDQSSNVAAAGLINALDGLRSVTSQEDARRLWWVAGGMLDGVRSGLIEAQQAVKLLFGRVDREIKRLTDSGEQSFRLEPPRDLTKNLLYYAAHARGNDGRIGELKRTYKLEQLLPSEKELQHAQGSLTGRNKALLDTVSGAIKEDLMRVKDALDLYLRTASPNPGDLAAQTESLDRVADTLGMLGLGVPRRVITEQRGILNQIVSGQRPAEEGTLLDIAGALLFVEASLDDNIDRLGAEEEAKKPEDATALELPQVEVRRILEALMKEVQANLTQVKQDIVAFIESGWQHDKAVSIPRLFEEIGGAMRMVQLDEASALLDAMARFIDVEVLRHKRVPTADQMDRLADAVASIEYYLEATHAQRAGRDKILEVTTESLEALGYWPLPAEEPVPAATAPVETPMPTPAPTVAMPVPPAPSAPAEPMAVATPVAAPVVPAIEAPKLADTQELPVIEVPELSVSLDDFNFTLEKPTQIGADTSESPVRGVQLPGANEVDEFLGRLSSGVQADYVEPVKPTPPAPEIEMRSVVEIAPGESMDALIVGETAPSTEPKSVQDVVGLKFAETLPNTPEPVQPLAVQPAASSPVAVAPEPVEDEYELVWIEEEREVIEEAPINNDGAFQAVPSDDIDEEIREVFLEEVQEEVENLGRALPDWKANTADFDRLKPVRRSFHTMKGSGRLVGAMALGEFSWKIENMLNRVLDKSIAISPAVLDLLDKALEALPKLLGALRGEAVSGVNVPGIMEVADKLAAGEEAWLRPAEPIRRIEKVRVQVSRLKPKPVAPPAPVVAPVSDSVIAPSVELTESIDMFTPFDEVSVVETLPAPVSNVDPMMLEILRSEVATHLVTVRGYLVRARSLGGGVPVTEAVLRAVHTMHGAIAMVDLPAIAPLLGPLEGYFKRLRAAEEAPDSVGVDAVQDAADVIEAVIAGADQPGFAEPDTQQLVEHLTRLRNGLPEPESTLSVFNLTVDEEDESEFAGAVAATSDAAWTVPVAETSEIPHAWSEAVEAASEAISLESVSQGDEPSIELAGDSLDVSQTPPVTETSGDSEFELALDSLSFANEPETTVQELMEAPAIDDSVSVSLDGGDGFENFDWGSLETISLEEPASAEGIRFEAQESPTAVETESDDVAEHAALFDALETSDAVDQGAVSGALDDEAPVLEVEDADLELPAASEPEAPVAVEPAPVFTAHEDWSIERAFAEAEIDPVATVEVDETSWFTNPSDATEVTSDTAAELDATPAESTAVPTAQAPETSAPVALVAADSLAVGSEAEESASVHQVEVTYAPIAADPNPDGALDLPDMDEDLLEIFVQEGGDILDAADTMISKLREAPEEREIVTALQRELHTLKGGARMAGLSPIGDLSHAMEALLEAVSDGRLNMNRVSLESLERGFDRLHQLVTRVSERKAIANPANAITRFELLVEGVEIATVPTDDAGTPSVMPLPVPVVPAPAATPASDAAKAAASRAARELVDEVEEVGRAAQEMIRVRSDLLDNLVNYAGEVSIYRSRLEQQMGTFRFNLQELEQTVTRLREQLRKLEIETEAQIIARYQREHENAEGGEFDPLELDRFSTLQQLSRALAESVSDLTALQNSLDDLTRQAETLLLQQSRVSSDLQEGLMRTRMVPFDSVVPRLRRLMRQTSGELGKRANLRVEGAQGEMDRNVLDRMTAPLEHMLRNSLAHGLEMPGDRVALGKNEEGVVTIGISREATEVVIRVSDDGRGMDRDAIRRKAIERGLMKPDAQLSDRDLFGFVLEAGFSTAETVSKIAGRGVGMDVVHSEIKQLGGSLAIDSKRGVGTEFTVRLPFTLAVTQAILVRLGEHLYAVPMSSVQGVVRIKREDLETRMRTASPTYSYGGDDYLIYDMADVLGLNMHRQTDDDQLPLLMVRSGDQRAAVRVDAVLGSREVVVKSVGPQISSVPGIFGATIMGDGSVVMILDMAPLVRKVAALRQVEIGEDGEIIPVVPVVKPVIEQRRQPLIMVVDDSITMRKVTSRVLERNDMEVATAKDGLDAVEKLQDRIPDLVLLDIEMPRMDGYELATYMRNDPRLKAVPIIMITSRTGEKHRQRAMEIGVDRYLGKPYQEADLLRNVDEILRLSRAVH